MAGAFLLLAFLTFPGRSAGDPAVAPGEGGPPPALAALVSETPDVVRLRIQSAGDVEPGSVEVRFAGRKAVVLARDAEGRAIRSQPLRLPEPVVETGASAEYDTDGALVVTLQKQATAEDAPMDSPEAPVR